MNRPERKGDPRKEGIADRSRDAIGDQDERITALTAKADPVLAALLDNDKDAAYDRL